MQFDWTNFQSLLVASELNKNYQNDLLVVDCALVEAAVIACVVVSDVAAAVVADVVDGVVVVFVVVFSVASSCFYSAFQTATYEPHLMFDFSKEY